MSTYRLEFRFNFNSEVFKRAEEEGEGFFPANSSVLRILLGDGCAFEGDLPNGAEEKRLSSHFSDLSNKQLAERLHNLKPLDVKEPLDVKDFLAMSPDKLLGFFQETDGAFSKFRITEKKPGRGYSGNPVTIVTLVPR